MRDEPPQRDVAPGADRECRKQELRVRSRVLARAIERANERLAADGLAALPEGMTLHALRRTFASVLVALGHDPRYAMDQIGHSNLNVTLGVYAQVMRVSDEDRARLRAFVEGGEQDGDTHIGARLAA